MEMIDNMANRGGFSWKRYLGITKAKRRVSRATGIPWTKGGRQRKIGKAVTGGCCAIPFFGFLAVVIAVVALTVSAFAHPGMIDGKGGHVVSAEGWGYEIGTYHVHDRYGEVVPVAKDTMLPTEITVSVDGERVIFDQKPVNIDGRVLVPVRYVVEKLGCEVEWDGVTQTVYIFDGVDIRGVVDTSQIEVVVNGELVFFDVPPQNISGRVLIPIRAVVEKLGCTVEWDGNLQTVYIESEEYKAEKNASSEQAQGGSDYTSGSTGESDIAPDNSLFDDEYIVVEEPSEEKEVQEKNIFSVQREDGQKYVLNTSKKKIHKPTCGSVKDIKPENKAEGKWKIEDLEQFDYEPCGRCKPR